MDNQDADERRDARPNLVDCNSDTGLSERGGFIGFSRSSTPWILDVAFPGLS